MQLHTAAADLQATREATRAAQEVAQRQLEAEHRPLLIDVAPGSPVSDVLTPATRYAVSPELKQGHPYVQLSFPRGHSVNIDPYLVHVHIASGWAFVGLPLRNVGRGLATINPQDIRLFGPGLGELAQCDVLRERVPPGESSRILCASRYDHAKEVNFPHVLQLIVPYRDVNGAQLSAAVFDLVQPEREEPWTVRTVRQASTGDVGLPSGIGPPLPQQ